VDVARFLQRGADAADAAIHHVGRRDDVDARLCLRQRLLDQDLQRDVVEDVARLVDHAVLTVRGIGIQRDIRHDAQLREARFQRSSGARHEPARIECLSPVGALQPLLDDRKKRHDRNARGHALLGDRQQPIQRHALHARHGIHFLGAGFSVEHEYGVDEVIGRKHGLAHEPAREIVSPHAPHAHCRELAVELHLTDFYRGLRGGNFSAERCILLVDDVHRLPLLLPERVP